MSVSVQREDFDIAAEIARLSAADADIGAVVSFTGLVRRMTADGPITRLGDLLPAIEKGLQAVEAGGTHLIDVKADTGYAQAPLMPGRG